VSRALARIGVAGLAHTMGHSAACTLGALGAYLGSLLLAGAPALAAALPPGVAPALHTACLAATFVLVGLPQVGGRGRQGAVWWAQRAARITLGLWPKRCARCCLVLVLMAPLPSPVRNPLRVVGR
jgi:hypothetical protein